MIFVFNNSFQKWIRNISGNVFTVVIFRNIENDYYIREKSIRYIGCLTIIFNIVVIKILILK